MGKNQERGTSMEMFSDDKFHLMPCLGEVLTLGRLRYGLGAVPSDQASIKLGVDVV